MRLNAEIHTERLIGDDRAAVRRTLRLGVSTYSSADVAVALILNMSERGLLIETFVKLAVGETLLVEIPEANAPAIRVIWTDNFLAGCEFVDPLSPSAMSAAQLKSAVNPASSTSASAAVSESSAEAPQANSNESPIQTAIVIVTTVISVLALTLLWAAILLLS